jgi:hypothetical protein
VAQDGAGAPLPGVSVRVGGGHPLPLTLGGAGRFGFTLTTGALPRTGDGRFYRFTLACGWTGAPAPVERTFLVPTGH